MAEIDEAFGDFGTCGKGMNNAALTVFGARGVDHEEGEQTLALIPQLGEGLFAELVVLKGRVVSGGDLEIEPGHAFHAVFKIIREIEIRQIVDRGTANPGGQIPAEEGRGADLFTSLGDKTVGHALGLHIEIHALANSASGCARGEEAVVVKLEGVEVLHDQKIPVGRFEPSAVGGNKDDGAGGILSYGGFGEEGLGVVFECG